MAELERGALRLGAMMRRHQRSQPGAIDKRHVVHVEHDFLFATGDQAFHFFAKRVALFTEHDAPVQRNHSHAIHFAVRHLKCHILISSSEAAPAATGAGPAEHISNSPRKTCNSRKPDKSAYSATTPAAGNRRDNTAKHLPAEQRVFALAAQLAAARPPRHPAEPERAPGWPEQALASRHVPRRDGYSTSTCRGKAQGRQRKRYSEFEPGPGSESKTRRRKIIRRVTKAFLSASIMLESRVVGKVRDHASIWDFCANHIGRSRFIGRAAARRRNPRARGGTCAHSGSARHSGTCAARHGSACTTCRCSPCNSAPSVRRASHAPSWFRDHDAQSRQRQPNGSSR